IAEKSALIYKTSDIEGKGKGPIAVFIDESGSMDGVPIENAKAMALAITWIAKQQKRHCYIVRFSGSKKIEDSRICDISPGDDSSDSIMEWLGEFMNGGTVPDVPFKESMKLPMFDKSVNQWDGNSDIIVITDGEMLIPDDMKKNFIDW